jgi:mono/diheme cytochrome c family protein
MQPKLAAATLAFALAAAQVALAAGADAPDAASIARGRYLVQVGGCNDCHTNHYAETGGNVPEKQWLAGSALGWQGPWGTTYPANLRLVVRDMSEDQWNVRVASPLRPPMPWFNLKAMSDGDRRAIYRYIRSLGPAGVPAPAYAPPGVAVATPVVTWPAPPEHKQAVR